MVEYTGRDPEAVGLSWMAWYALMGEEPPEHVSIYLKKANHMLGELGKSAFDDGNNELSEKLAGLHLFIIGLESCFDIDSNSDFKLELKQRKRGARPKNKNKIAKRGRFAADDVQKLIDAGQDTESAISEVSADTGLSRSELFKWLASNRVIMSLAKSAK